MDVRSINPCACSADVAAISTLKLWPPSVTWGLRAEAGMVAHAAHANTATMMGESSHETVRIRGTSDRGKPQCSAVCVRSLPNRNRSRYSWRPARRKSIRGVPRLGNFLPRLLTAPEDSLQWAAHETKCHATRNRKVSHHKAP